MPCVHDSILVNGAMSWVVAEHVALEAARWRWRSGAVPCGTVQSQGSALPNIYRTVTSSGPDLEL